MLDIRIAIRTPRYDVPLYSTLVVLFSFSAPRYALLSSWVPASSRIPSVQSEALGGGGKVDVWRGRMGAVGEEGGPRERDSATCRKEAPEGALRMLQCVVGVPCGTVVPAPWHHPVPRQTAFFPGRELGRISFRILFSQTLAPPHLISFRLDSTRPLPHIVSVSCPLLSLSLDPHLHALPRASTPPLSPPNLCPPAHST
ncbi:hypothetical protein DFH08DRAFT_487129 [Mycena albidolilacea]|uniref:Uncharacterized protein n=1 Tax=Mycena albidolilacea TaxID=1033008 RepID=A0AAD6Z5N8_9AGAR|nr:hypothetical protein DFH08DRAFT_487129 [Mycena albidolilacea]